MNTGTVVLAAIGGAVLVCVSLGLRQLVSRIAALLATKAGRSPFEARAVMNQGERALYGRVLRAAPTGSVVLAQVQLSAFIQVRGLKDSRERWKYLNRIIRLSVDFLVVDSTSMAPLVGIELDGSTHRGRAAFFSGQLDADTRKNQAFASAGIPLVRIAVGQKLSDEALRSMLVRRAIGASGQRG